MYTEKIKLMALSTEMKKHVKFWAFSSEILHTSGDVNDLQSIGVEVAEDVLEGLDSHVGYFKSKKSSQYFASYSLNQSELERVSLSFHHPNAQINDFWLVCNTSGLYVKFNLTVNKQNIYFFVKLIHYP